MKSGSKQSRSTSLWYFLYVAGINTRDGLLVQEEQLERTSVSSLSDNQSSVYNCMGTDYPSNGIHACIKNIKSIIVNRTERQFQLFQFVSMGRNRLA